MLSKTWVEKELSYSSSICQFTGRKRPACAKCVAACPGLAVFLINPAFGPEEGTVSIPYEFLPLPDEGQRVRALDRDGQDVGEGRILKVRKPKAFDGTPVVTVGVPKALLSTVRHIRW